MEAFDQNSGKEQPPIHMTEAELEKLQNLDVDNEELVKLMEAKGISPGMGEIKVKVGGEEITITTDKDDFGTTVH
mgnify:FL=1